MASLVNQVIKAIVITEKSGKVIRLFPDKDRLYWDMSTVEAGGRTLWYYQMHIVSVMDLIYRAGEVGSSVRIDYFGGAKREL